MQILKDIFTTIWSIYAALVMVAILIPIIPIYAIFFLIFGNRFLRTALYITHHFWIQWVMLPLYLIWVKRSGTKHIQKGQPYVILSNHRSTIDILINARSFPYALRFLAKKEVGSLPAFGPLGRQLCVLVDRKSPESRAVSFENMRETVEDLKIPILLYPEGTRNRTLHPLKSFYDGGFKLAIETQTPILVQTLVNTGNIYPPFRSIGLRPGIVTVHFDKPIETKNLTLEDIPMLKAKVKNLMESHLKNKHFSTEFKFFANRLAQEKA